MITCSSVTDDSLGLVARNSGYSVTKSTNMKIPFIPILFAAVLPLCHAGDKDDAREVRKSPDGLFYVGWFDLDAGEPFGIIRPVVVRSATDLQDIFSFVSTPRDTKAAWNPASNRCVIADAPDNGGPKVWLVYQKSLDEWAHREIEPFATIYTSFRKTDPDVHYLFRPSILKIEWLSDTRVRFRGYCNIGT
jgi:hypothetical protein